jgi:alpha-D-ribose 1-methylphosphonate 5-triphosphate diphosphatase
LCCETHTIGTERRLLEAVEKPKIDYVIFNDHIGEAIGTFSSDPEALAMCATAQTAVCLPTSDW